MLTNINYYIYLEESNRADMELLGRRVFSQLVLMTIPMETGKALELPVMSTHVLHCRDGISDRYLSCLHARASIEFDAIKDVEAVGIWIIPSHASVPSLVGRLGMIQVNHQLEGVDLHGHDVWYQEFNDIRIPYKNR